MRVYRQFLSESNPDGSTGILPAPDLPARLARTHIAKVDWTDQAGSLPFGYRCDVLISQDQTSLRYGVTVRPGEMDREIARQTVTARQEFARNHGYISSHAVPRLLFLIDRHLRESRLKPPRQSYRYFRESGPWHYVPADDFPDWRIRASQVVGPAIDTSTMLQLVHRMTVCGAPSYRDVRLRVFYEPR